MSLAGLIAELSYPPLCPNCGSAANTPLPIPKVFKFDHGGESPGGNRIAEANPLFCNPCIERHRLEAPRPGLIDILETAVFSEAIIPAAAPLGVARISADIGHARFRFR